MMTARADDEQKEMRCLGCAYDLRGLAQHRCPECGRAFDPADARTFLQQPVDGLRLLGWMSLSVVCMIFPFVAGMILPMEILIWVGVIGVISQLGGFALFWFTTTSAVNVIRGRDPWAIHLWAIRTVAILGVLGFAALLLLALSTIARDVFGI